MIIDSLVYVIGKGYLSPEDLFLGDHVYKLQNNKIEVGPIEKIQSDFLSSKINVINSGQFGSKSTDDSRFLFVDGFGEYAELEWHEIPSQTNNKEYKDKKYLPVLTAIDESDRTHTDSELDGAARALTINQYDVREMIKFLQSLTGRDNYIFIEFLENWASFDPGRGYGFNKVLVKSRALIVNHKIIAQELCRVANFAGWTAEIAPHENYWFVAINFEATPTLGSVPKTQKYYNEDYIGMVYNIHAGNAPILGRTAFGKYCFIPTISRLND